MKTNGVKLTAAFLLSILTGGIASAQDPSFVLANNTGFTVYSVYIWPTGDASPGPDRLGNATISSGDIYAFMPEDDACRFNIRVTLAETDDVKQWNNVNLCRMSTLTLNYNYLDQNLTASTRGR